MSLIYRYKPDKDRAMLPLTSVLVKAGVTPNLVTVSGLIISLIAGGFAALGHLHIGIALFFISACLDALDGSLARATGGCTEFGRYLDSVCDRCSEFAFIAGAVIGGSPLSALFVVAGSMALLLARVHVHRRGLRSDKARFSRPERLALIIIALFVPYPFNTIIFLAAGTLSLISAVQVLFASRRARASTKKLEPATFALKNI
jgi:phosphatidylglycerophosphate synthase